MPTHSVSERLEDIKQGHDEAAAFLWERYFPDLLRVARQKLGRTPQRMEDGEDVVLSAFDSFCKAADQGRFPNLTDRQSLWRLLYRITCRKAIDLIRRSQTTLGDARVLTRSPGQDDSSDQFVFAGRAVEAADVAAMMADEVSRLLEMLPSEEFRSIAVAKMDAATNKEIAADLGCALRTVERRLKYIRAIWQQEIDLCDANRDDAACNSTSD